MVYNRNGHHGHYQRPYVRQSRCSRLHSQQRYPHEGTSIDYINWRPFSVETKKTAVDKFFLWTERNWLARAASIAGATWLSMLLLFLVWWNM